jgi:hypothetical protein
MGMMIVYWIGDVLASRLPAIMLLAIREIHAAESRDKLNTEWFVVENTGDKAFSTAGCQIAIGKGSSRLRPVGTIDPGFTIAPGAKVRVVTGNPGKKAQGAAPEAADVKNYHLFLPNQLLEGPGSILAMSLKQHELVRATFDPKAQTGVAAPAPAAK